MNPVTVYFSLVRLMCDSYSVIATDTYAGFSRSAYQVRVLSAMIDKVRYMLNSSRSSEEFYRI